MMSSKMLIIAVLAITSIQLTILAIINNQIKEMTYMVEALDTRMAQFKMASPPDSPIANSPSCPPVTSPTCPPAASCSTCPPAPSCPTCPPAGSSTCPPDSDQIKQQFHKAFLDEGSDKVTVHHYDNIYSKYLPALMRQPKVKVLEIGYGCTNFAPHKVGGSMRAWKSVIGKERLDLYLIEYDAACLVRAKPELDALGVHAFPGDQSNRTFLQNFLKEVGGDFDFIVDDGGHSMNQMRTSLEELFPAIKPGRFYAVEDMQVVSWPKDDWYDSEPLINTVMKGTIDVLMGFKPNENQFINKTGGGHMEYISTISHVDCMAEMCILTKKS